MFACLTEGGGLKLFGPYRTNTFQKGASLTHSLLLSRLVWCDSGGDEDSYSNMLVVGLILLAILVSSIDKILKQLLWWGHSTLGSGVALYNNFCLSPLYLKFVSQPHFGAKIKNSVRYQHNIDINDNISINLKYQSTRSHPSINNSWWLIMPRALLQKKIHKVDLLSTLKGMWINRTPCMET